MALEHEKVIEFRELKKELFKEKMRRKAREAKDKAKEAAGKAVVTVVNHPAESLAVFTGVVALSKKGMQLHKVKMEDKRRLCDFYDPRCGRHVITKRPLTRKESIRAQKLYDSDKNARWATILDDMGLL